MPETQDVLIVGGGVISLSVAYALGLRGVRSTVLDRGRLGGEASWAGAGMIPPAGESEGRGVGLSAIAALRSWSARLFPEWSEALREETGIDNGYRRSGGVDVAWTEAEAQALAASAGRWRAEGIACERLAPADRARVEPALAPSLREVYFLPDRAQVRNPRHLRALAVAVERRGVRLLAGVAAEGLEADAARGRVRGVRTAGGTIPCAHLVLAAGAWTGRLLAPLGISLATPPIKGQIVLLRHERPLLRRIVEHGKSYLVPRDDGRILVGATEEHAGFDVRPTEAAYEALRAEAVRLCPVLAEAEVEATWTGLRPGSLDGKPYLGLAPGLGNVMVAAGHGRAGLQLSPATGELVADLVLGLPTRVNPAAFRPDREPSPADDSFRS